MPALEYKALSPEVYTLADTYQLGTPQKEFRARPTRTHIISSAFFIAVSLCLGVVAFLLLTGQNPYRLLGALFICAAVVALAIGFAILLKPVRHRSRYVYLCSDGFLFIEGKNIQPFRWDTIEAMWQHKPENDDTQTATSHTYRVRRRDGSTIVLNDLFPHIEILGRRIREEVTNCLLPQAIMNVSAGQVVTFGPLRVSAEGISNGRELLPWQQIQDIRLERDMLTVKKQDRLRRWPSIQVANVPNIFIFLSLVRHILRKAK